MRHCEALLWKIRRPACAWLEPTRRSASFGRRGFFQNIDEQHLAHELKNIVATAHGTGVEPGAFNPFLKIKPRRAPRAPALTVDETDCPPSSGDASEGNFQASSRSKPWLRYESLRGSTYPDTGQGPRWQDLTHNEAQRLQEMYLRKRMLDRKLHWLRMQHLPNPERDAKLTIRRQKVMEEAEQERLDMYPPPFLDTPIAGGHQRLQDEARQLEMESRFRQRIRLQKLESAKIAKSQVPDVAGLINDPIKRHVHRRLVRQRRKIHEGLEEVLTRNSAQILYEFMKGVAISIVKIRAPRPRATQEIYYNLSSDHDPAWVQRQLEILAPKLRSQLAVSVNMGQTPNIRFVPNAMFQEEKKSYLWGLARTIKNDIPGGGDHRRRR